MRISDGMKRYIGLTKLPPAALGSCWEHGPFPYETYRMQAIKLLDRWIFEEYATGKIDHDIFLVLAPAILAFSAWGAHYSVDARTLAKSKSHRVALDAWPVSLFVLIIGLGMFTSGWAKLTTRWLDPTTSSTLG